MLTFSRDKGRSRSSGNLAAHKHNHRQRTMQMTYLGRRRLEESNGIRGKAEFRQAPGVI